MSLDPAALARATAAHGPVVRVVVAKVEGSAPRETGAAMLVWADGFSGTIGGGALEYEALAAARRMLADGPHRATRTQMLGPDLGQCCGGAVTLLFETWDAPAVTALGTTHASPLDPAASESQGPPPGAGRLRAQAQTPDARPGAPPRPQLTDGWFVEPVAPPGVPVWIWGAGHVGRALAAILAPLPEISLTWLDTAPERFPDAIPAGVTTRAAPDLAAVLADAPADAHHIVVTYSHDLDFTLCDAGLARGFAGFGLIGSATKWARFRKRLEQAGHPAAEIARIACPIGDPGLGKHPQAIAVGVANRLLMSVAQATATDRPADRGKGYRDG